MGVRVHAITACSLADSQFPWTFVALRVRVLRIFRLKSVLTCFLRRALGRPVPSSYPHGHSVLRFLS